MLYENEKLLMLKKKVERKDFLTDEIPNLNRKRYEVRSRVFQLKHDMEKSQSELESITAFGLKRIIYKIFGSFDKKLERAQNTAQNAADKYKAADSNLLDIENKLAKLEQEFRQLANIEKEYKEEFDRKVDLIKALGILEARDINIMESDLNFLRKDVQEIDAATKAAYDLLGDYKCMEALKRDIMSYRSDGDSLYSSEYDEYMQDKRNYDSLKSKTAVKLKSLRTKLVKVSALVKKYGISDSFSYISNADLQYTSDPGRMAWRIEPVYNGISRACEKIEETYNIAFKKYEEFVLGLDI